MQPHSMCALGLATYVWEKSDMACPQAIEMKVVYRNRDQLYKTNYYSLSSITEDDDRRRLVVSIRRMGDGDTCTVTISRKSTELGSEISMKHSVPHTANLEEVFRIYESRISDGKHYNSMKYGEYRGGFSQADRKHIQLRCDVKTESGSFITVDYDLYMRIL